MSKIALFVIIVIATVLPCQAAEWAEIYQSKVIALHETPDDFTVQFSPQSFRFAVNITSLNPKPGVGWSYDFNTEEFAPPAPVPISLITSKQFFQRLTTAEMEALVTSVDAKVVWFRYWLTLSGNVNLGDPQIITAVNMLENKGIVGVGRAAIILTIGTE